MNPIRPDLMHEATRLTRAGRLNEATEVLLRALGRTAGTGSVPRAAPRPTWTTVPDLAIAAPPASTPAWTPTAPSAAPALVLEGNVFEQTARPSTPPRAAEAGPGAFTAGTHTHASHTLRYKLYIPSAHDGRPLPLVVMLHGCTQDPDDFAAGTGMNERAREQGFFVLYPQQASHANPSACWNWFKHNHQQRGRGEPALLASLTQAVMRQYGIDPRRVYIAGLSAGGAMAAIVAAAYPELFAAVGVHSGLPGGAAARRATLPKRSRS